MIYVETNSVDPAVNLAYEEHFLQCGSQESVLMLWQNRPTVVVGRYQNTLEEVDTAFVEKNDIHVIRRMTGGGAVYHDNGNLCYSFILRGVNRAGVDFSMFAKPVLHSLEQLGVKAALSGRNDLTVDGKKISGTAMSLYRENLLFHGTLLYDSKLTVLEQALRPKALKLQSHASQSARSRVTNIRPYMRTPCDVATFKHALKGEFQREFHFLEHSITPYEEASIHHLAQTKYKSWDWTWGQNPACNLIRQKKYAGGLLEIHLDLKAAHIQRCFIRGDFLGLEPVDALEKSLEGIPYEETALRKTLNGQDISRCLYNIQPSEFLECLLGTS